MRQAIITQTIALLNDLKNPPKTESDFSWAKILLKATATPLTGNFEISEDKHFFFEHQHGHIWYKNLNIPPIQVSLHSAAQELLKNSESTEDNIIEAHISSVKFDQPLQSYSEINLVGDLTQVLENGTCTFNGLKFMDTSFNSNGSKFFLLILMIRRPKESTENSYLLLDAYISSPLYIESRKKSHQERQSNFCMFDPFLPESLEKSYIKVKPKTSETVGIGNDVEGLFNYFTAYSIRHKILHPVFLLLRFHNAIKLYYNSDLVQITQTKSNSKEFLITLQKQMFTYLFNNTQQNEASSCIQNKILILSLNQPQDQVKTGNPLFKKVAKFLKPLHSQAVHFSKFIIPTMPSNFKEIKYSEELREMYKANYSIMAQQKIFMNIKTNDYVICREDANSKNSTKSCSPNHSALISPPASASEATKKDDQSPSNQTQVVQQAVAFESNQQQQHQHQQKAIQQPVKLEHEAELKLIKDSKVPIQIQNMIQVQQQEMQRQRDLIEQSQLLYHTPQRQQHSQFSQLSNSQLLMPQTQMPNIFYPPQQYLPNTAISTPPNMLPPYYYMNEQQQYNPYYVDVAQMHQMQQIQQVAQYQYMQYQPNHSSVNPSALSADYSQYYPFNQTPYYMPAQL